MENGNAQSSAEVFYGIWMYRNYNIFGNKGAYSDPKVVTRNNKIIDSLVYRRWMKPKYRSHIGNLFM